MWEQTNHGQISGLTKRNAIDCLLTAIFFCYVGFYNGIGPQKIKSLGVTSVAPFFFYKTVTTFHSGFMLKWN